MRFLLSWPLLIGFSLSTFRFLSTCASKIISARARSYCSVFMGVSCARLTALTDFMEGGQLLPVSPSLAFLRMWFTRKLPSLVFSGSRCVFLKLISFFSFSSVDSLRAGPSLGRAMFLSLQVKEGTYHSFFSSLHSELLTTWSICSWVMMIARMELYFLHSFSCSRMVSSSSYLSSSCSFCRSFSSCRLATYLFFISLKRSFISSTSSFRDLQFFSMFSSYYSRFYFSRRYSSSFFFCDFSFYFSFFIFSSSVLSWVSGAFGSKCFCKFSSFYCSNRFYSCSLRSWFSFYLSYCSSWVLFSLSSLQRQTMRSWMMDVGSPWVICIKGLLSIGPLPSSIIFSFFISYIYSRSRASLGSSLTLGLFWMNLARLAQRRVLRVQSQLQFAGETAAIMMVLVLPPNES